ncbi:cupin domain-containing protein [Mycobacterium xenopi]|uniref:Cupin n=1 Tax=Mycobacterium xenopi TaxID=1789 RepID=A0AAD1H051_MYCXE|nr:cupin domain-containing protein [Mycobacterium xenopi]MDA3641790.1 cupin domain-containing protein [Mycobacterium xenopi]MDA3664013.1 cupin domain-containing protein [Mycobacterium xenopi]ORX21063.1 cupin [Mycobacterium xenopi]SPX92636.1 cupin domain-containing protein [Mycobacterium xenopi]BBU22654.1 cupin [Mycobacterium xenopi]
MADEREAQLAVVQPGEGDAVAIPGFGAVFKLSSRTTAGEVAIVEHPFAVGFVTAPHMHTREDEHSIVLAGEIGFRSDDSEVVLGPGGYITKPRGQMHAMWNAGSEPGRIVEVITPGGFENYFHELSELLVSHTGDPDAPTLHQSPEFAELAQKYGLTYGTPEWLDDVVHRYGLKPPSH